MPQPPRFLLCLSCPMKSASPHRTHDVSKLGKYPCHVSNKGHTEVSLEVREVFPFFQLRSYRSEKGRKMIEDATHSDSLGA